MCPQQEQQADAQLMCCLHVMRLQPISTYCAQTDSSVGLESNNAVLYLACCLCRLLFHLYLQRVLGVAPLTPISVSQCYCAGMQVAVRGPVCSDTLQWTEAEKQMSQQQHHQVLS